MKLITVEVKHGIDILGIRLSLNHMHHLTPWSRVCLEKFIICLYYSYRALSQIKHTLLNQQMTLIIFLDIICYNLCKLVQHVSIPSWDHHQGLL